MSVKSQATHDVYNKQRNQLAAVTKPFSATYGKQAIPGCTITKAVYRLFSQLHIYSYDSFCSLETILDQHYSYSVQVVTK